MGDGKLSIGAPPQQRIALPTPAERAMLMQIVGQEYPELSPRHMIAGDTARLDPGAANFDHHFVAGLMFLSYVKRSDAVDRERSPWWFLEACRQWLREESSRGRHAHRLAAVFGRRCRLGCSPRRLA